MIINDKLKAFLFECDVSKPTYAHKVSLNFVLSCKYRDYLLKHKFLKLISGDSNRTSMFVLTKKGHKLKVVYDQLDKLISTK